MHRIKVTSIGMWLTTFLIVGASTDFAAACGNGKLIFEDKFASLDRAWKFDGGDAGMFSTGQDGLVAEVPPKRTLSAIHQGGRYENFEVCAKFEAKSVKDSGDFVALRFWTPDGKVEYWAVTFTGHGWYVVNYYPPDQDPRPVTPQVDNPSLLKEGLNEASVTVNGNKGIFLVNGKKIGEFSGDPPEGGSVFGFALYSSKANTEPTTFVLKSIELREPSTANQ